MEKFLNQMSKNTSKFFSSRYDTNPRSNPEYFKIIQQLTLFALVDVVGAVHPFIPCGAGARERAVDRAGIADRALVARVRRAGVVEMAEQP